MPDASDLINTVTETSEAAKNWVRDNASPDLIGILSSALENNLFTSLSKFIGWLDAKIQDSGEAETGWQGAYDLRDADKVATTFIISEEISGSATARNFRFEDSAVSSANLIKSRLGVGVAFESSSEEPIPVFLTEHARMYQDVVDAKDRHNLSARVINLGVAQSSNPILGRTRSCAIDHEIWRPAKPVSRLGGPYGSLSLFVSYVAKGSDSRLVGFLSAGHVLSRLGPGADQIDVTSPVPPFVKQRKISHRIGHVVEAPELFHYSTADSPDRVINYVDVALSSISDRIKSDIEICNLVPNPGHESVDCYRPDGFSQLSANWTEFDPIEMRTIFDIDKIEDSRSLFLKNTVYKFGATSGLTVGKVEAISVRSYRIKMPNKKNYLFGDLMVVRSTVNGVSFSLPGDSGAIVYTQDGVAIGTIVGASSEFSLVCPLKRALESLSEYDCRLEVSDGWSTIQ